MNALAALALVASLAVPPAGARWVVSPRIELASPGEVTLADLVPSAPETWKRVSLGRAPRPGTERVLDGTWLRQRAREVGAEASIEVPESVVIALPGRPLDGDAVARAVEEAFAPRLAEGQVLRVSSVGATGLVPEGELKIEVREPEGDLGRASVVWVDLLSDGARVGRAWARVELDTGATSVVLKRNGRRGDVIGRDDLELRPAKRGARGGLGDVEEAAGKRLTRSVTAGSALAASDVETVPGVQRGDAVRLVARVGSVTAATNGRALETVALGQALKVENVGSRRVIMGTLTAPGVVDVCLDCEVKP